MFLTLSSFVFFTALVGCITWWITRHDDNSSAEGFFLAGRSLTFPLIAGSLLLTNLSTEQLIGLNGAAYTDGLCVMVWEVVTVSALVFMAWFFLPKFLRSGVSTVPEYLAIRFDSQTQTIANFILLFAYVGILLPIILYTGATGLMGILDVPTLLGGASKDACLWLIVWIVGIIGSIYALFGGLKSVAVSDTINGVGLLVGGLMITAFGLAQLGGDGGMIGGANVLVEQQQDRFNSIGGPESSVPFGTVFSGILLLCLFYWTTNQQIIQRTFGASSLAEGQKGVLLTGALKLLGPLFLVIPGMIAFAMFADQGIDKDDAYGKLVNTVLPAPLTGFFAAVIVGAILSSFNSALNSSCTLFSVGFYKAVLNKDASEKQVVKSGRIFGAVIAIGAMIIAPLLNHPAIVEQGIFSYLQKMNGIYAIPIFAVVLVGMLTRRVPAVAAKAGLLIGIAVVSIGYFVPPFDKIVASLHDFHFIGIVFSWLVIMMLVIGEIKPRETEFVQQDVGAVDMTPWKYTKPAGIALLFMILAIYIFFADFSVLSPTSK